jgi:hypothetical protein
VLTTPTTFLPPKEVRKGSAAYAAGRRVQQSKEDGMSHPKYTVIVANPDGEIERGTVPTEYEARLVITETVMSVEDLAGVTITVTEHEA